MFSTRMAATGFRSLSAAEHATSNAALRTAAFIHAGVAASLRFAATQLSRPAAPLLAGLALLGLGMPSGPAAAVEVLRLAPGEKPVIDGRVDEAFWQRIKPIDQFTDWLPRDKTPSRFPTEVRFAYDGQTLYVGIIARDPDPSLIRAPFVRRDKVLGDQDFVAVLIDPVGSKKFAQFFRVGANGVLADGLFNDANNNEDFAPDFEYTGAAQRTPDGWTAEMSIPFSSLRCLDGANQRWNVLVFRGATREEFHRAAHVPLPRDWNCLVCYAEPLTGLTDLPTSRHLSVVPQFTASSRRDQPGNGANIRKNDFKGGVDIKFSPRADTVIDATINPDFSQIELDTPQLSSNNQFALFFQEKRPFFLEGSDLFDTPVNLIYTRSITDPAWGARATQRRENTEFTVLTARDDGGGFVLLPGALGTNFASQDRKSQATFVRGRTHLDSHLTLGGTVTDRNYEGAGYNRVVSSDVVWRPAPEQRLRAQLAHSETTALPGSDGRLTRDAQRGGTSAFIDWFFNNETWNHYLQYEEMSRDFRADNGFISQSGFKEVVYEGRRKFPRLWGLNELSLYWNTNRVLDRNGAVVYQQINPGISLAASRATYVNLELRPNQQVRISESGLPLKRDQVFINLESQPSNWLPYFYSEIALGDRVDVANNRVGKGYYFASSARLRPHPRVEIEPRIDDATIDSDEPASRGQRILHERATQLLGIYHLSAQDSLRLIWQQGFVKRNASLWSSPVSAAEHNRTASVVYAHRPSLNTSIYVGATLGRNESTNTPNAARTRELFVKVSAPLDRFLQ